MTGGPGSGKTALINRLREAGYATADEAGRGVIQDQEAIGGLALPWVDPEAFAELMLCWEMRSYRTATREKARTVFFDRGIPDIVGYLRLEKRPVPNHINVAAQSFRYHSRVFIAPPWREIYEQDDERKQTFEEAERTYESMVGTYTEYGYELTELGRTSTEERFRFILDTLH
ncbi:putative ATPase [Lipingzhangella halophila]|uniref:Putative ATPase n=1 Tax=Lipingzhangella halophila TaxID=1783352 RepID=A0A7W7RKH7_9ACTN|nr:AAA family ATPase [Lipingzhangella halophila]MBB4933679.1 putative ATPase [Lipingzhangella halophila]